MKRHIIFLISIICLCLPSAVHAVEGLPGSAWGDLHWEVPKSGDNNVILEGWIRQGIAWEKWQKETTNFQLTTYLTARYKWDQKEFDWDNYLSPGAGISIDMSRPNGPLVSLGLEHLYQMNYRSGTQEGKSALFMNWYHWWNFDNKKYPGATWGDLRWEIPNTGTGDAILQTWVRQGIVIKRWDYGSNNFLLNPYLKFSYKGDSESLDWNNYFGSAVGIALDMESAKGPILSWGIEYVWENNIRTGDHPQRITVFMMWYFWWDLIKKGPSQ
jgi:hypothetical protein